MNSTRLELTPLQKTMAKRMALSWTGVPHFSMEREFSCESMLDYRKRLAYNPSYTTILIKAVALTLRDFPLLNASFEQDHILAHGDVNIGVATDTKRGLLVPVIKDAVHKSLKEIHDEMTEYKERAKTGKYSLEMLEGGTFTISNMGMLGVTSFTSIVNAPQSAILSVARMMEAPVVRNGNIVAEKQIKLTMNIDHRVTDGAYGARFLNDLIVRMETGLDDMT